MCTENSTKSIHTGIERERERKRKKLKNRTNEQEGGRVEWSTLTRGNRCWFLLCAMIWENDECRKQYCRCFFGFLETHDLSSIDADMVGAFLYIHSHLFQTVDLFILSQWGTRERRKVNEQQRWLACTVCVCVLASKRASKRQPKQREQARSLVHFQLLLLLCIDFCCFFVAMIFFPFRLLFSFHRVCVCFQLVVQPRYKDNNLTFKTTNETLFAWNIYIAV